MIIVSKTKGIICRINDSLYFSVFLKYIENPTVTTIKMGISRKNTDTKLTTVIRIGLAFSNIKVWGYISPVINKINESGMNNAHQIIKIIKLTFFICMFPSPHNRLTQKIDNDFYL